MNYRTVLWDSSPMGAVVQRAPTDDWRDMVIIASNAAALEITHLREEDIGKSWRELGWDRVAQEQGEHQFQLCIDQRGVQNEHVDAVRADTGEAVSFWNRYVPMGDRTLLVIFDDVTDMMEQQRQANLALEDLEETFKVISHDLDEPLRGIEGYVSLIISRGFPLLEEVHTVLQTYAPGDVFLDLAQRVEKLRCKWIAGVARDAGKMRRNLEATKEFSRAGRFPMPGPVRLSDVVGDAAGHLSSLIESTEADVQYPLSMPVVLGSSRHLVSVFQNLIHNAIKYRHEHRRPTVAVHCRESPKWVQVVVQDNGQGFSADQSDKIFDAGHRLHPKVSGTGMGLAIARRIVERHGGVISAVSQPGIGSEFTVLLPRPAGDLIS